MHTVIRYTLQLAAFITLIIGLLLLLAPEVTVEPFSNGNVTDHHFIRFIGTALVGFAFTNWLYSRTPNPVVALPAIYGNIISLVLAILVDVVGLAAGILHASALFILALHVGFAALFSYCVILLHKGRAGA